MEIDSSKLTVEDGEAIAKVQEFMDAWNHLQSLQQQQELGIKVDPGELADTEAQVDSLRQELNTLSDTPVLINAKIDTSGNAGEIANSIKNASEGDIQKAVTLSVDSSAVDAYKPEDKKAKVIFNADHGLVDGYKPADKYATVHYKSDTSQLQTSLPPLYRKVIEKKVAGVDGTAHAKGTAYAHGNWGIKGNGVALTSELGTELLIRDGHWYDIGEDSAEFIKYQAGDISKIVSSYSDVCVKFI